MASLTLIGLSLCAAAVLWGRRRCGAPLTMRAPPRQQHAASSSAGAMFRRRPMALSREAAAEA